MHFLITRMDNIGDVVLSLVVPSVLKKQYGSDAKITYVTREYTKCVIDACPDVDDWISYDELMKLSEPDAVAFFKKFNFDVFIPLRQDEYMTRLAYKAGIPKRIGHIYRTYFLRYSNKLIFRFKRKRCEHHQAQTELQYLKALHLPWEYSRAALCEMIHLVPPPSKAVDKLLTPGTFHLVIHPGNNGNTVSWSIESFAKLMGMIPPQVKIYLSGSAKEKDIFKDLLKAHPNTVDLFGKMPLDEYMYFLSKVNGLVVGSTGPLHLGAALKTLVIGLFPPHADMNVQRWGGLAQDAINIEAPHCPDSLKGIRCGCMTKITPEQVFAVMQKEWKV